MLITLQGIGNTLLTLPLLKALKKRGCSLHIIVSGNGSDQVIKMTDLADRIFVWAEGQSALQNVMNITTSLRREKYDAAFALCPAGKRENTLLRLARADFKCGWRSEYAGKLWSFTDIQMPFWDEKEHDLLSNGMLVGIPEDELKASFYEFRTSLKYRQINRQKIHLGMQIFSKDKAKCWPESQFRELIGKLSDQFELELTFFGSSSESEKLERFSDQLFPAANINIIKGRPWIEVLQELKSIDVFLGIDSAVSHFSSLMGIPTCVLFAFTNPQRISPLGENTLLVQTDYPCCPCYRFAKGYFQDCDYHLRCIQNLDVQDVFEIMTSFIRFRFNDPVGFVCANTPTAKVTSLFGGGKQMQISGKD